MRQAMPILDDLLANKKYFLGKLCKRGHKHGETEQSLRNHNNANCCVQCTREGRTKFYASPQGKISRIRGRDSQRVRRRERNLNKLIEKHKEAFCPLSFVDEFDIKLFCLDIPCKHKHEFRDTKLGLKRIYAGRKHCVQCANESSKRSYHRNKSQEKNRRNNQRESTKLAKKRYEKSEKCRQKGREYSRKYIKSENYRLHIVRYKESGRMSKVKTRYARSEKGRLSSRRYYTSEKGKLKLQVNKAKRKSRELGVHHIPYTPEQWLERKIEFNHLCAYCHVSSVEITLDHFLPIGNGGTDTLGNILPSCRRCNSSKNDSDPWEWYQKQPFFCIKRWKKILKVLGKNQRNYDQLALL